MPDPLFTRSGSHPATPPISDEVRHCLYTWSERRLHMASIQLTPEWLQHSTTKGNLVFEQFVEIFSETQSGEVLEDTIEKPIDLVTVAELPSRYADRKWAFAISGLTFRRQIDPGLLNVPADHPDAKAKFAIIAHGVAVYDLIHRRLAGVCFVPGTTPDAPEAHPLVMLAFGSQKLLEAFRADLSTIHVVTPVRYSHDLEFLPWLLFVIRDVQLSEVIAGAPAHIPRECLLGTSELFFFGLPTTFDNFLDRTVVFPKVPTPTDESLLVGVNFGFALGGRPLDINLRFCDSGAEQGHAPHIDVEVQDRGRAGDPGLPLPRTKVVDHYPVQLEKIREFELASTFVAYVASRPNAAWERVLGAEALQEHIGLELAMITDPECRAAVRRVLGDVAEELPELVRAFNYIFHLHRASSRALQKEINAQVRRLWCVATTSHARIALTEMVVTLHRSMMALAREQLSNDATPDVAFDAFHARGREVLAALGAWVPPTGGPK